MKKPFINIYPLDNTIGVTTDGRVWDIQNSCWKDQNFDSIGRARCQAYGNNRLVHRLVMLTHNFRRDHASLDVHHADGDHSNNNFSNLYWLNRRSHSQIHSGMRKGKNNGRST